MDHQCFFLCFRVDRSGGLIQWDEPLGGLVMQAEDVDGIPLADFDLARSILEQRFHCLPKEQLLIAEVYGDEEKWTAKLLDRHYELEMHEFMDLMGVQS